MNYMIEYIQPSRIRLHDSNRFSRILLLIFANATGYCGIIWLILEILSRGTLEVFGWLALGSLFVCVLLLIPVITDLIMLKLQKVKIEEVSNEPALLISLPLVEVEIRDFNDEHAREIRTSNWAAVGLSESIVFTIVLGIFGLVFGEITFQNSDLVMIMSKSGLLFLLIFLLVFGGHFMSHMISAMPSAQRNSMERTAQKETDLLYPCLYIGGFLGFVYGIVIGGIGVPLLRTTALGTLISGSLISTVSLIYWFLKIWSPSQDSSLNISTAMNETEMRRARLLNSTHNTIVLIGFLFALWSLYTTTYVLSYSMLLVAAVIMMIFNQFPYAVGEHNLCQALIYKVREELVTLETEFRWLSNQKNKQARNKLEKARVRLDELRKEREQIEKDHPLFVSYSLLAAGPLGWLVSELIKQIAR